MNCEQNTKVTRSREKRQLIELVISPCSVKRNKLIPATVIHLEIHASWIASSADRQNCLVKRVVFGPHIEALLGSGDGAAKMHPPSCGFQQSELARP